MKMLTLFATFTLGLASQLASAQESGYYLGVGLGKSAINFNDDDFSTQTGAIKSTVTNDTGYKLFAGYNFNENWAIEAGYADLGRFESKWAATTELYNHNIYTFNYKASSWFMAAKGSLPVTGHLKLFGKLGVTVNKSEDTFALGGSGHIEPPLAPCLPGMGDCYPAFSRSAIFSKPGSYTTTRTDMLTGLGVEYRASKNASIRLEYEDFGEFGNQDNTGRAKLSLWSLGVIYNF